MRAAPSAHKQVDCQGQTTNTLVTKGFGQILLVLTALERMVVIFTLVIATGYGIGLILYRYSVTATETVIIKGDEGTGDERNHNYSASPRSPRHAPH